MKLKIFMEENKTAEAVQVQDKPIIHPDQTHQAQESIGKGFESSSSNNCNNYNYTNSYSQNHGSSIPFGNQLKLAMDVNWNLDWLMSGITRIPRSYSLYASTSANSGDRAPMSTSKLPNYYHNVPVITQPISSWEYNWMGNKAPLSGRSSSVKTQHLNHRYEESL